MRAFAIFLFAAATPAAALTASPTATGVVLRGGIAPGDDTAVLPRLRGLVELDSVGGDVAAALAIAETIRRRGLTTIVPAGARCLSACTILWFAGTRRIAHSTSVIAVHRAGAQSEALADVVTANIAERLLRYGAPPSVIAMMVATPSATMRALTAEDLPLDIEILP